MLILFDMWTFLVGSSINQVIEKKSYEQPELHLTKQPMCWDLAWLVLHGKCDAYVYVWGYASIATVSDVAGLGDGAYACC